MASMLPNLPPPLPIFHVSQDTFNLRTAISDALHTLYTVPGIPAIFRIEDDYELLTEYTLDAHFNVELWFGWHESCMDWARQNMDFRTGGEEAWMAEKALEQFEERNVVWERGRMEMLFKEKMEFENVVFWLKIVCVRK